MIRPAEIQKKANNEVLSKALAFKGGTVLKEFYFKDYRYSEDLDFTLVDDGISNETIQDALKEVTIGLGAFIHNSNAWARVVSLGLTSFFISSYILIA